MSHTDRGVSEVIGFVLIFGLVMAGIGLVTMYGYPLLMSAKANADSKNMEQTQIIIQNEMKSLAYKSVPYREIGIQVAGGTLYVNPNATVKRYLSVSSPPGTLLGTDFYPGELHYYSTNGVHSVIQNGAVISAFDSATGSVMLSEPNWYIDDSGGEKSLVLNLISISPDPSSGKYSQTSFGTVKMKMGTPITNTYKISSGEKVRVDYTEGGEEIPKYKTAWTNFMKSVFNQDPDGPDTPAFTLSGIQKVIVTEFPIAISSL